MNWKRAADLHVGKELYWETERDDQFGVTQIVYLPVVVVGFDDEETVVLDPQGRERGVDRSDLFEEA